MIFNLDQIRLTWYIYDWWDLVWANERQKGERHKHDFLSNIIKQ